MTRRIACLAVAVWLGAVGARADELKALSFGAIASDSSAAIKQRYEPPQGARARDRFVIPSAACRAKILSAACRARTAP